MIEFLTDHLSRCCALSFHLTHLSYDSITTTSFELLISPLSHISPNHLKNVAQPFDLLSPYHPSLSPNRLSPKIKFAQTSFAQLVFRPTI